jgi:hypothetical protein
MRLGLPTPGKLISFGPQEVAVFAKTKAFSGFGRRHPRARQLYEGTLGLDVTEENGMLGLHIADGGDIMIYPKPDHTPATFTILNFPVEDIDRAVEDRPGMESRWCATRE